jgi:hypothetical protein
MKYKYNSLWFETVQYLWCDLLCKIVFLFSVNNINNNAPLYTKQGQLIRDERMWRRTPNLHTHLHLKLLWKLQMEPESSV